MRALRGFLLVSLMLGSSGCKIVFGPGFGPAGDDDGGSSSDDGSSGGEDTSPILPEPDNGYAVPGPVLTTEQQDRARERDRYIADTYYQGFTIVRTVQMPSGDIIDWIDDGTLPALPYAPPELAWSQDLITLPAGVELAVNELEQFPDLLGPFGSTPFHRPMFWGYVLGETDASSIEDYLDRYQVSGSPASPHRYYAGLPFTAPSRGVSGYMNQQSPAVAPQSFSILEFAVSCPPRDVGPLEELVGLVISVDTVNHYNRPGDMKPRLHVEHFRMVNGKLVNAWDSARFVRNPGSLVAPGSVVPVSTAGGLQVEHRVDILQWTNGDWWISYNGILLGYYPGSLFTKLNQGACAGGWYTEVLDQTTPSGGTWVKTEIGTGQFPVDGDLRSAWVRRPKYLDMSWLEQDPPPFNYMTPNNDACYQKTPLKDLGPLFGQQFLAGGPGGNNPACTKP
jgi:hypothetical protein